MAGKTAVVNHPSLLIRLVRPDQAQRLPEEIPSQPNKKQVTLVFGLVTFYQKKLSG
jgi:hypothetical protein